MTTKAKDVDTLEREYLASKQQIQENPTLSFEKKQLQIKALGDEFYARRRKLEEEAA